MIKKDSSHSDSINSSFQKVAKGTFLIFAGTIIGMGALFISRLFIARSYSQQEYGIFSLLYVIISIFSTISLMGLKEGVARQIAHSNSNNNTIKTKGIIFSSIVSVSIISLLIFIILYNFSGIISIYIFDDEQIILPLKIISIAIPFLSLTYLFSSIFRGFERVKERIIFENLLLHCLFLIFLLPLFFFKIKFIFIISLYSLSIIINFLIYILYIYKNKSLLLLSKVKEYKKNFYAKELLFFSLPLLIISILYMTMSWADSIMLGFFKNVETVGLYNSALPLARLLPVIHSSMGFIYLPIASSLIARKQSAKLKNFYVLISRWIVLFTLPLFSIFFFFPEFILSFLFGYNYIGASFVLVILSIGFIIHVILGPNGSTLTAFGRIKIQMYSSFASMISNIVLNILLIPTYGIVGAAVATALSLAIPNFILTAHLYQYYKIHPLLSNYVKPVFLSISLIFIISLLFKNLSVSLLSVIIYFILVSIICISSVFLTKSLFSEDADLIRTIGKKIGIDMKFILKFFND